MRTIEQRQGLIDDVVAALAPAHPDVEVVDVEVTGGRDEALTIYIDRPGGVDLDLCEAVTRDLDGLRDRYALSVSSPGLDRPLRTPGHFAAARGVRVFVRTAEPLDGRAVYRGRLTEPGPPELALALDEGGSVRIPYTTIAKAHVIFEFDDDGGHP